MSPMFQTKAAMACSILATLIAIPYLIVAIFAIMLEEQFEENTQVYYDYSSWRECRTISGGDHTTEYSTYETSEKMPPSYK